jgi:hypothetical protein
MRKPARMLAKRVADGIIRCSATRTGRAEMLGGIELTCPSRWTSLLLGAFALGGVSSAHAWIYPEHRDIAVLAVESLVESAITVVAEALRDRASK